MILTRWFAVVVVLGWSGNSVANGDLCSSSTFEVAFIEGQGAVDFPSVGPKLIKLGDAAVPCLERIAGAESGAPEIEECQRNQRKCRSWAVLGLSSIGTARAKNALLDLLEHGGDPVTLVQVVSGLASLRVQEARPAILPLLQNASPYVRAHSVLALGVLCDSRDVDAMIRATMSLPRNNLNEAIRGLELTGSPKVISALEDLAEKFPDPIIQDETARTIERIRTGKAIRPEVQDEKK